jgi:mRNA-degrading endonuclease RelE of RelBE toxin-antitoxin system
MFIISPLFKKKVQTLSPEMQKLLKKKLSLFVDNPKHPSSYSKKIQGTDRIFESRINLDIRFTWQFDGDDIILRNIGSHDPTLKSP